MRVLVPDKHTVLIDIDGSDNLRNMLDPGLVVIAHRMGLTTSVGVGESVDPWKYGDVWIDGPDEEVALFKLKYL